MFSQVAPLSVKFYVNKVVVGAFSVCADGGAYVANVLINKPIDKTQAAA